MKRAVSSLGVGILASYEGVVPSMAKRAKAVAT
jgi:hypothetical protein